MRRFALKSFLYFPSRAIEHTPMAVGLTFRDLAIETEDGERLHGWWIEASAPPIGRLLVCHGNAGNVGDRIVHAELLCAAGFDVLLFDYRGYGRSSGIPGEHGTYADARAARTELLAQPDVDDSRLFYLGESLGGAVATRLALECPPRGLIVQSAFTSVRRMARLHYPFIPRALVPDAYPSLRLIGALNAPLLILHGERDKIVPVSEGRALFDAVPEPKRIEVFPDAGHNDLIPLAGARYTEAIASWAKEIVGVP